MCGRYVLTATKTTIANHFALDLGTLAVDLAPRYNIAPTQPVLAVRETLSHGHEAAMLQWGLVPSWASDPTIGSRLINARAETIEEKPSFRSALKRRRCLLPADGFYEWRKGSRGREPHFICARDAAPLGFAGLWEVWERPEGYLETCAIVTVPANDLLSPLHDRMPLILKPEDYALWLDTGVHKPDALRPLFAPFPAEKMKLYPVSPLVNRVGFDGPELIEPVGTTPAEHAVQEALDM